MRDAPSGTPDGPDPRLPVTLLSGFLGSGKTTLLNRLLTDEHGERIAVIVNEFGDVGIDGDLVAAAEDDLVELTNGCVCCTVRGDLERTALDLLTRRERRVLPLRFDRLVIEASGLATPGPVLQTFLVGGELAARTRVAGVVTLAHGGHIARQLEAEPVAAEQVAYADRILLNHCDTVSVEELDAAEAALRRVNGMAEVRRAVRAEVDQDFALRGGWEPVGDLHPHGDHGGVSTVALTHDAALDLHRLKIWLQFLASRKTHELMRAKGIFRCEGQREPVVVQSVYQFLELGPGEGEAPEVSRLVLIGRDLDHEELHRGWARVTEP